MSSSTKCVHCGADSNPAAFHVYCVACGKETTPVRVPEERTRLAHAAARSSAARVVSQILFAVASLHLLCLSTSVGVIKMFQAPQAEPGNGIWVGAALIVANAVVFAGLGCWARFRPLPAALTGLIFYGLVLAGEFAANRERPAGIGTKIAIVAMLLWAVVAGVRARNERQASS
jgi:hypothetical protein